MASEYLSAPLWPAYITGAASLALAVWLLVAGGRRRLNRAFAAYLVTTAGAQVLQSIVQVAGSSETALALLSTGVKWEMLAGVALVSFIGAAGWPRARWIGPAAWTYIALILATAAWRPAWLFEVGPFADAGGIRFGEVAIVAVGPLVAWAMVPVWTMGGVGAAVLAWLAARASNPRRRRSWFLLALVFITLSSHAAIRVLLVWTVAYDEAVAPASGVGLGFVRVLQPVLEGGVGLALAGWGAMVLLRRDGAQRSEAWMLVGFVAFAALNAIMSVVGYRGPMAAAFDGMQALALPVIAAYAILRHHLFDIDVKARFTVKSTTLAAVFLAVFVGVQQFVGEYFSDTAGLTVGAVAAGALFFVLVPLQRFADRVATAAVPDAKPIVEMDADEKALAYGEVVRMAWLDGKVTPAERRGLEQARIRLGLSVESAHAAEQRALAEAG